MANASLTAETGRATGSASSRRLRSEDKIPGVLYGHGMSPVSLSVARRELRAALSGPAGLNTIIDLKVGGSTYPAIVKELQRHPVRRTVSHIDFQQISMTEEIVVNVPIRLSGTAKAVVSEGGLVDPAVDSIEVRTTPSALPNEIVIDITNMTVEDVIHLRDVALPAGVTAVGDPDLVVVTVLTTRADSGAPAAAPAAEGGAPAAS
ncbi:MAG: ribosomal protein [Actinomycetota bacterium]|jgi:large subunit ribosomal protein L25